MVLVYSIISDITVWIKVSFLVRFVFDICDEKFYFFGLIFTDNKLKNFENQYFVT